jgi:serine/threonine protein kinase
MPRTPEVSMEPTHASEMASTRRQPTARVLLRAGETVADTYRVRRVLAIGGMGVVYQVISLEDGRPLAMKTLLPDFARDAALVHRFDREIRAMKRLAHPGIVSVVDSVVDRDMRFLLMPLVAGRTLDRLGTPLAVRRALVFARQILDALEHAHGMRVVHRDLKPQNLLVADERAPSATVERVKILDFGIAKILHDAGASESFRISRSEFTRGTPRYMAPEQVQRGAEIDHRCDLYALGVILFEALTGTSPFDGPDDLTIMKRHVQDPPPFLGDVVPAARFCVPALELLIATALAKDPDRRFADAARMRATLDEALDCLERRGLLD